MARKWPLPAGVPSDMAGMTKFVAEILLRNDFPADTVGLFVSQAMLESGWMDNRGSSQLRNLTGIKKASSPQNSAFLKALGVTYTPVGAKREGGTYYCVYPSWDAWAKDYRRVLCIPHSAGRMIDSTSVAQMVNLARSYATDKGGAANYARNLPSVHKRVSTYLSQLGNSLKKKNSPDGGWLSFAWVWDVLAGKKH